jgi:exopolysaccharide biosynthesis polyprenyl glycosylphosphotransferase
MLNNTQKDYRICIVVADQCALVVSLVLAIVFRSYLPKQTPFEMREALLGAIALRHVGFAALWYFSMRSTGAYELIGNGGWGLWRAVKGTLIFTLLALAIAFFRDSFFSRGAILLFVCLAVLVTIAFRHAVPAIYRLAFPLTVSTRVLLVGEAHESVDVKSCLERFLKCQVILRHLAGNLIHNAPLESLKTEFERLLKEARPDEVILAIARADLEALATMLNACNERHIPWHFVPSLDQLVFGNSYTHLIAGIPLISLKQSNLSGFNLVVKRFIDMSLAAMILALVAPLMATIWLVVRLTSRGPAIFVQQRIGRNRRLFNCYKFRTMKVSQDQSAHKEYAKQWIANQAYASETEQQTFKIVGDKRITPVGAFLRKYSLDELPQIVNVLKGDMSLVGPRPALSYEVEMYQEWHKERLDGIPGLTGEWQVGGRYSLSFDEMVKLDLEYLRNWTPSRDFKVLLKTVPTVLQGTGK